MEKLGTGFLTVFRSYEEMGLKPPQVIEGENFIKCILPREQGATDRISDNEKILRLFFTADNISVSDVVKQLGIARSTAGRRLSELHIAGKLIRTGKGRASTYSLAK
jgi:predicted HTH transcriptional regulator